MTSLTETEGLAMMPPVDLMLRPDGSYHCANWCDEGVTSMRGNFCPKCAWDELFYLTCKGVKFEPGSSITVYQREMFDRKGLRLL